VREAVDRGVEGREAFSQAVLELIGLARHELRMVAPDFSDWPLASNAGAAALRAALQRGVRLRMLVADPQWLATRADRFLTLHRRYAAQSAVRQYPERLRLEEATLVADRQHAVRKPHPDSRTARLIIAMPSSVEAHADRLAAAWDESVDCLPATTLGL
jgi:phosphatidylserine/phosphatidylglycerophosphate/cardiolipin synthase-like enzyme